jgi:uncharacterized RmlC-like cupin family protein
MVEGHDGILVIRAGENCRDWNGIHYKEGLSGKNVGAKALSMNVATIPPGGVAYAHIHVGFEVMLYILAGRVRHEYGDGLKQIVENTAGDFIFIGPACRCSTSAYRSVVAVVARSDGSGPISFHAKKTVSRRTHNSPPAARYRAWRHSPSSPRGASLRDR